MACSQSTESDASHRAAPLGEAPKSAQIFRNPMKAIGFRHHADPLADTSIPARRDRDQHPTPSHVTRRLQVIDQLCHASGSSGPSG